MAPELASPVALPARLRLIAPGLLLTTGVAIASLGVARIEEGLFGNAVIEGLVVAILVGMLIRSLWTPTVGLERGIGFAAKEVLEVAIVLLGASADLPLLLKAGPALALGIVLLVILGLALSYGIGRALGLPHPLAVLVACGNSICGNSAIAAVAPVIRANRDQVASAIAFTAILGVVVVVGLPRLVEPLGLSHYQYGVLAGLTVYAVPQVLAAAFPVSVLSGQVGTLVKLVRVLMLGPVVLFFTLTHRGPVVSPDRRARRRFPVASALPWFIVGFLGMAVLRSTGALPASFGVALKTVSTWLTVIAMAALGLGVDLRAIRKVGKPVILTVSASLLALIGLSLGLIRILAIE